MSRRCGRWRPFGSFLLLHPLVPSNLWLILQIIGEDDVSTALPCRKKLPKGLQRPHRLLIFHGYGLPAWWAFPMVGSRWMHIDPGLLCNRKKLVELGQSLRSKSGRSSVKGAKGQKYPDAVDSEFLHSCEVFSSDLCVELLPNL